MDRQQSTLLKGVAILMMLWYHLFGREELAELCTPLLFLGDEPVARMLTRACYPVSFFLILSGYGLCCVYRQGRLNVKDQLRRLLRLYIHYWLILIVFVAIGHFIDPAKYTLNPILLATNITGLHCTYNGETWFLLPYAIICLLAVGFLPLLLKMGWRQALLLTIGYAVCFGAMKLFMVRFSEQMTGSYGYIFILQVVFIINNIFFFVLGILLFRLLNSTNKLFSRSLPVAVLLFMLMLLVVVKSQFKITLADGIYALLFILLFLQLPLPKGLSAVLTAMGHHSMPMWMTHTFFAVYLFPDFIYGFHYPLIIFLVLALVTYIIAFPILAVAHHLIKALKI